MRLFSSYWGWDLEQCWMYDAWIRIRTIKFRIQALRSFWQSQLSQLASQINLIMRDSWGWWKYKNWRTRKKLDPYGYRQTDNTIWQTRKNSETHLFFSIKSYKMTEIETKIAQNWDRTWALPLVQTQATRVVDEDQVLKMKCIVCVVPLLHSALKADFPYCYTRPDNLQFQMLTISFI
jgi:hypothetical protein